MDYFGSLTRAACWLNGDDDHCSVSTVIWNPLLDVDVAYELGIGLLTRPTTELLAESRPKPKAQPTTDQLTPLGRELLLLKGGDKPMRGTKSAEWLEPW